MRSTVAMLVACQLAIPAAAVARTVAVAAGPRACGIRFSGTRTHVVVLRGVSCATALRIARAYGGGRPRSPWRCALAHAPFHPLAGRKVGFTCGYGRSSGDVERWPHAFVGTL